jgi:biopolymer transport protein ExbD
MMFGSMFRRKFEYKVPGLNTTSTADISFMLLIFFLVTTSMDADKGITRELPPIDKKSENTPTNVANDKTLRLRIDDAGRLFCNGHPMEITALKDSAEHVIERGGKEHVIQLKTERNASYDSYFHVQNELVAAYNSIRNEKAVQAYGEPYEQLSEAQKETIIKAVPQRISETYIEVDNQQ